METNHKIGLILGKFAPFHKGHQYLLEYALERVDKLYVLVYNDEGISGVSLYNRARWIREIYSDNEKEIIVIEGDHSPTIDDHSEECIRIQDDYIVSVMPEKITHFFSSEWYGEHVAKALGAKNCIVDIDRTIVPISATKIRENRGLGPIFLHPIVNRDFVKKVVFLGGESTGKSTLTLECAQLYAACCVKEYGREYWIANRDKNGKLTGDQLAELAELHIAEEEKMYQISQGICFVDTNAFITKLFCEHYGLEVPQKLENLVKLEKSRYDIFVVCADDIPFVQDGTRNDEELRREFQKKIIEHLSREKIEYYIVRGSLEDRMHMLSNVILMKFGILPYEMEKLDV